MSEGKKLKSVVIHDKEAIVVIHRSAKRTRCSGPERELRSKRSLKKGIVLRKKSVSESSYNRRRRCRKTTTNEGPRSAVDLAAGGLVVTINRATVRSSAGHVGLAAIAAHPVSIITASVRGDRIWLVIGIWKSYHEPLGGPLVITGMLCTRSVVRPRVVYCCCCWYGCC